MATKHEQVIDYIRKIPVNHEISVRRIARDLSVSEGTAYRGIKAAEMKGLVKTKDRVGTVRIEQSLAYRHQNISVRDVVALTDAKILGGSLGLDYVVQDFIVGAMKEESIISYLKENLLLITGNRENVQKLSLNHGIPVIITGGFQTTQEVIDLADEKKIPIVSVTYDTYSVVKIINKVLSERAVQRNLVLVEDIYVPLKKAKFLRENETVAEYWELSRRTTHSRYPVVNDEGEVVGVVSAKDLFNTTPFTSIHSIMTKNPLVAKLNMSVASVTQLMLWDNLEMVPVVNEENQLVGLMSRQDVLYTMQFTRQSSDNDYRLEALINDKIKSLTTDEGQTYYQFTSDGSFGSNLGTLSETLLGAIIAFVGHRYVYEQFNEFGVLEAFNYFYFEAVDFNKSIQIYPELIYQTRRNCKLSIIVKYGKAKIASAVISLNMLIEK